MAEISNDDKYSKCSRCKMKYHNHDEHINKDFGFNRLNERFKTCMRCRQYKLDNRELILQQGRERAKEYYDSNRDKELARKEEYYEDNKDIKLKRSKEYYGDNKDKTNAKIKCNVCGSILSRHGMARHQLTNKCKKAISI